MSLENAMPQKNTPTPIPQQWQNPSEEKKPEYHMRSYAHRDEIPFEPANALLLEHGALMAGILERATGYLLNHHQHIATFWENIDTVLPPNGHFLHAISPQGTLLGTGALRTVAPGVGEMKHLFVRPEARGMGLGRALVEARITAARAMGLHRLVADAVLGNDRMPNLYAALGFEQVPSHPYCGSSKVDPKLAERLLYFTKTL
jgi:GNAT superfamily N-acetyltransferase